MRCEPPIARRTLPRSAPAPGPEAVDPATPAYVVGQALSHRDERPINDELLQVEQGEREQLVGDVEDVLRRRRDDNDQEARHALL